jgi:heme-degrading monooxygenase HmoA
MSVIMTLWAQGDPEKLESAAAEKQEHIAGIAEAAKEHGCIAHRFYGHTEGGQIMVIDEWPDQESFNRFFESQEAEIGEVMQAAGISSQPGINFWRKLETHDEIGWSD